VPPISVMPYHAGTLLGRGCFVLRAAARVILPFLRGEIQLLATGLRLLASARRLPGVLWLARGQPLDDAQRELVMILDGES
jgi:hypothetical protein